MPHVLCPPHPIQLPCLQSIPHRPPGACRQPWAMPPMQQRRRHPIGTRRSVEWKPQKAQTRCGKHAGQLIGPQTRNPAALKKTMAWRFKSFQAQHRACYAWESGPEASGAATGSSNGSTTSTGPLRNSPIFSDVASMGPVVKIGVASRCFASIMPTSL